MYKKHTLPRCAGIALALLLLANTSARADLIAWSYNWSPNAANVSANGGGSGDLSFSNTAPNNALGASNTVITNIHAYSTASSTNPATFTNVPVTFTMRLTDSASQQSGSLTFTGTLSGTLTANSANVQLTYPSATTPQTMTLGGNTYTVSIGTYTPPGPPGASNAGSLNAFVTVAPATGGGGISSVPEPSALVLTGLALPWVGLSGWRRMRRKCK
ncbi:MAG: PEP-CTERM sorting domain-containing protein [Gemmataceae bacterium]